MSDVSPGLKGSIEGAEMNPTSAHSYVSNCVPTRFGPEGGKL